MLSDSECSGHREWLITINLQLSSIRAFLEILVLLFAGWSEKKTKAVHGKTQNTESEWNTRSKIVIKEYRAPLNSYNKIVISSGA